MARRFTDPKLVVASHNAGKVREIADLMRPFGVEVVAAGALSLPEPAETETTFQGNARIKSHSAARAAGLPAELEVYAGTLHGWCPPDSAVYHEAQAERAWSRLLALFETALA